MSENKIFDYRDYVDTSRLMVAANSEEIRDTLAQLSQIPEFQNVLKSAYELEGGKIILTNVKGEGSYVQMGNSAYVPHGAVNIDALDVAMTRYKTLDTNEYEPMSLQQVIVHEFIHKADPNTQMEVLRAAVHGAGMTQEEVEMNFEKRAVDQTNLIMSKYYQEPNRGEYPETSTLVADSATANNYEELLLIRPLTGSKDELLPSRGTPATECAIESMQQQAPAEKAAPPNPLLACMANLSKDELAMFERTRAMIAGKPSDSSLTTQQEAGRQATPQDAIVVSQSGRDY